jgi:hypothetical protein
MDPVHYLSSCLISTLTLTYVFQKVFPLELHLSPPQYMSHALFITSFMFWSPKYVTFHEEHKSCSHPLFNFLFCSSLLGPAILFCLHIITPRLSSLPTTDKFLCFYLFIVCIFTQKMISIDHKLMCPIHFQSLLAYSEMELKRNGDKTSCCKLFWRGNVSDMFAFLDATMCLFQHILIDTNFVDMPYWMRMYKIFHFGRLMFCYIVFTFSVLVLTNAEYLIGMWSITLKLTPIANFLKGFKVSCKHIHCVSQIKYDT